MLGIQATMSELIHARPARGKTGFAPSGRVSTQLWGANQSVFRGRGMEFAESRAYQPGDDIRAIDWRVTARTGKTHTKLYNEERERPVHILLDMREMMQFGTRVRFKSHLAAEVAGMLGWIALDGGDRVGGVILSRTGVHDFPLARTRRSLLRFLHAITEATAPMAVPDPQASPAGPALSLTDGVRRIRSVCRPGSMVFVISDFNDFTPSAEQELRRLSARALVTNVQITDPLDMSLPANAGRISDGAGAVALGNLSPRQLQSYADDFADRQARLAQLSRQHNMAFRPLTTQDPAGVILHPPQLDRRAA